MPGPRIRTRARVSVLEGDSEYRNSRKPTRDSANSIRLSRKPMIALGRHFRTRALLTTERAASSNSP